jgi:two-component system, OmpR family, sensor histidine kinase ChvG
MPVDDQQHSLIDGTDHNANQPNAMLSHDIQILLKSLIRRLSSSLTRRIVVLNLGGLVALLIGFLYLNQFREGLIDARIQSLQTQGEIIASAIAASAIVETDNITLDPEKLLQLAPGQSYGPNEDTEPSLEFSINPERIGPVLHRLVSPTRTRARLYDRDGYLVLDSRAINAQSSIIRYDLGPLSDGINPRLVERFWLWFKNHFSPVELPLYDDKATSDGHDFPEVRRAFSGVASSMVRINAEGETIVSVAVPVQRFRSVRGVLLLSTQGGDIDKIIGAERIKIFRIFMVSAGVMLVLSLFLASTIAEPMRRLAEAAERVRRGIKARQEIPDFSDRADEIGHLSGALRDMTSALYNRLDAIENFAADVAHELKNPLTSLRSAVETLPRVQNDQARKRLLDIIEHDVKRLDRLISDISDASRLDAELARADMEPVDCVKLLDAVISLAREVKRTHKINIMLNITPTDEQYKSTTPYFVNGFDSRLAQVINNLVDNACSFSPDGASVRVTMRPARNNGRNGQLEDGLEIIVDDDGPGIAAHAFERIFERFYTDRPDQGFGQNSGLGLSISRQIIEAHGGKIWALNRLQPQNQTIAGARFIVWLPAFKADRG